MSSFAEKARDMALGLSPGEHELTDARLRKVFGISRVTEIGRTEMANNLRAAGLKVLSDPAQEPLVVSKPRLALAEPPVAAPSPFYRRPWVMAVTAVLLVVLLGALVAPEFRDEPVGVGGGTGVGSGGTGQAEGTGSGAVTPPPGAKPNPKNLIPAAEALVAEDAYVQATDLVSGLASEDRDRVARAVSRRLAARTQGALDRGDRATAERLVDQAGRYPATSESEAARRAVAETVGG